MKKLFNLFKKVKGNSISYLIIIFVFIDLTIIGRKRLKIHGFINLNAKNA